MSLVKSVVITPKVVSRTPARVVCFSYDVKKVVETRKEMDKKRVERIKVIGAAIDDIARMEIREAVESIKVFMPFLEQLLARKAS